MADRAAFLLTNYPSLWDQAHFDAEDVLEGNRGHAFAEAGRDQGSHADPTANRAAKLFEVNVLIGDLSRVRQWIDYHLASADRPLLIARWRLGRYGWRHVSKELREEVAGCISRWEAICSQLDEYLHTSGRCISTGRSSG